MSWLCPKCKREFAKVNQSHSCVVYPLENHLRGKEKGALLFNLLLKKLSKLKFRIDSVPCCIHLVNVSTFVAVWVGKDKINIDFRINHAIKSKRILKEVKMSANRYLYYLEVKESGEIDKELIDWCIESYNLVK